MHSSSRAYSYSVNLVSFLILPLLIQMSDNLPADSLHRLFACDSQDKEMRHNFLLQAHTMLRQAVDMLDQELSCIHTLTSPHEVRFLL